MNFRYFLVFSLLVTPLSPANTPPLTTFTPTMCIDNYPPLQIIEPDGRVTGENVEVAKTFFRNAGYMLEFTGDVPFRRCLQWLREGKVDIMAGLIYTKNRAEEFNLYLYDDVTIKTFFIRKNAPDLTAFDDLKKKRIAVVRGVKNFERFDNANRYELVKVPVDTLQNAFGILAKNRVDAVVATDFYGNNILRNAPELASLIRQASYQIISGTKTYIAVSKKSPLTGKHDNLRHLAKEMYQAGEFQDQIALFQAQHPDLY